MAKKPISCTGFWVCYNHGPLILMIFMNDLSFNLDLSFPDTSHQKKIDHEIIYTLEMEKLLQIYSARSEVPDYNCETCKAKVMAANRSFYDPKESQYIIILLKRFQTHMYNKWHFTKAQYDAAVLNGESPTKGFSNETLNEFKNFSEPRSFKQKNLVKFPLEGLSLDSCMENPTAITWGKYSFNFACNFI